MQSQEPTKNPEYGPPVIASSKTDYFSGANQSDACVRVLIEDNSLPENWRNEASTERYIWQHICQEKEAKLESRQKKYKLVSSRFLRTILTHKKFLEVIPPKGVLISGADFNRTLDLSAIRVPWSIKIANSSFRDISFRDSFINGVLNLSSSKVFVDEDINKEVIDVPNDSAYLDLHRVEVTKSLFLRSTLSGRMDVKGSVNLQSAKIGGHLDLSGAAVTVHTNLTDVHVGLDLFLGAQSIPYSEFGFLDLNSARINGNVQLALTKIGFELSMSHVRVGGGVDFGNTAEIYTDVDLSYSQIGGSVRIPKGLIASVPRYISLDGSAVFDLTSAKIGGELHFIGNNRHQVEWPGHVLLVLRGTEVGLVTDDINENVWPYKLELDGFQYSQFGGSTSQGYEKSETRSLDWYLDWLSRDSTYSPQPYEQLASVIRASGRYSMADSILIAKEDIEFDIAWEQGRYVQWAFLGLQNVVIGYGYRLHDAIGWLIFFWWNGVVVLILTGENNTRNRIPWGFGFSLDKLLPVVELNIWHYEGVVLRSNFARWYFYFHQVSGYVLVALLVAGMTGLTT